MRAKVAIVFAGIVALACSSNNSATGPDPRNCTKGSISGATTITGTLNDKSCLRWDWQYSSPYTGDSVWTDSYDFHLDSGAAFIIDLQNQKDSAFDAVLELVGKNPNTGDDELLAISDDEGPVGTYWSQLYFVSPVSGTFSLRVSGYDISDTVAYSLQVRTCPTVLPIIKDSIIASAQAINISDCTLEQPDFTSDSVRIKLYTIWMDPNHAKRITVSSGAFFPGLQVYGPAFGTNCGYEYQGCGGGYVYSAGAPSIVSGGNGTGYGSIGGTISFWLYSDGYYGGYQNYPGQYTLAVGGAQFANTGAFTLTVQDFTGSDDRVRASRFVPSVFDNPLKDLKVKPVSPSAMFRRTKTGK